MKDATRWQLTNSFAIGFMLDPQASSGQPFHLAAQEFMNNSRTRSNSTTGRVYLLMEGWIPLPNLPNHSINV